MLDTVCTSRTATDVGSSYNFKPFFIQTSTGSQNTPPRALYSERLVTQQECIAMPENQKPVVLYRFEQVSDRARFEKQFATHFDVQACASDEEIIALAQQPERDIQALILDQKIINTTLPATLKKARPKLFAAQLHEQFSLDEVIRLLDSALIDRCFHKPIDASLLRSEIQMHRLAKTQSTGQHTQTQTRDQSYKALIVDDEKIATRFLVKQLQKLACPCDILVADSAEQALQMYETHGETLAVIISDERMPGLQGHEFLNEIKQRNPHTIRMLTSAYEEVDVALTAINEGRISRYLKKPWQADEINALITESLDRYRARRAQARSRQSSVTEQYEAVIEQRKQGLHAHLAQKPPPLFHANSLDQMFHALSNVDTLPPSAAALRASLESGLESELIWRFCDVVANEANPLWHLQHISPARLGSHQLGEALATAFRHNNGQGNIDHDANTKEPEVIVANALLSALKRLLDSTGARIEDWRVQVNADGFIIADRERRPLTLLKHLLSPFSTLSLPVLDQQGSLLVLVMLCTHFGIEVRLEGTEQALRLSLQILHAGGEHNAMGDA